MLAEILNYMKKNREASASEIALCLKMDRQMVETGLNELIRKGRINRHTVKHISCANCGCGCSSGSCPDITVYRYSGAI
ncbi:MAG TPA: FeoC-like transcriptional regulator [Spirochaetota bacterium]|nr:FeoC-like transcriptional regulator [Spirochaetota bacterium]HPJ33403.1 FeoC-like transcriptional regulator [Spirochaetota bacterium]